MNLAATTTDVAWYFLVGTYNAQHEFDGCRDGTDQAGFQLLPFEAAAEVKPRPISAYSRVLSPVSSRFHATGSAATSSSNGS